MGNDERAWWKITRKLEKGPLLAAVSCLAGLATFFFGYDQGIMGEVNDSKAYVKQMGLGHRT